MDKDLKLKKISLSEIPNYTANKSDSPSIRISVCGKRNSGKTCLVRSFLKKNFVKLKQETGINIYSKKMRLMGKYIPGNRIDVNKNDKIDVNPEINVVVSEFGFDQMNNEFFKKLGIYKAHAIIYCFDIEEMIKKNFQFINDESFLAFIKIFSEINDTYKNLYFAFNKLDTLQTKDLNSIKICDEGVLTEIGKNIQKQIKEFDANHALKFKDAFITSSFLHINVDELFTDIIQFIVDEYIEKEGDNELLENVGSDYQIKIKEGEDCKIF